MPASRKLIPGGAELASSARHSLTDKGFHVGVLTLDILTTAAILFAVAAGLMIILGVMKLINFAHGAFLTVGGYVAFFRFIAE